MKKPLKAYTCSRNVKYCWIWVSCVRRPWLASAWEKLINTGGCQEISVDNSTNDLRVLATDSKDKSFKNVFLLGNGKKKKGGVLTSLTSEPPSNNQQGCSQHPEKTVLNMAPWSPRWYNQGPFYAVSHHTPPLHPHQNRCWSGPQDAFHASEFCSILKHLPPVFLPHESFSNVIRTMPGKQGWLLSGKSFLILLAKINYSFL